MRKVIYILLLLALVFCKKDDDGYRIYTVKAGEHFCDNVIPTVKLNKHSLQFWFKVNDTWVMPHFSWSKIAGLSEGDHRENSCRLVYRCSNGFKIIGMYTIMNGIIDAHYLDTITNGEYYCDIGRVGDRWELTFCGEVYTSKAGKRGDFNSRLYPYIGGDETIDHDWVVPIRFL